jgi:cytochrome c oxidase cbb3-type subunit 3
MSGFWSAWIILLTSITIVGITWILLSNRHRSSEEETTGHIFDGIEEYDNPLPGWWLWGFLFTIVFGIGYLIIYPGFGHFSGVLGWTGVGQYEKAVDKANKEHGPMYQRLAATEIPELAQDEQAMRMARRLFNDSCAQCHGSDARGGRGYPNLTDKFWQWGGEPAQIKATIDGGRQAAMPSWQAALGDQGVAETSEYVLQLSGRNAEPTMAKAGEKHFQTYCVACHGAEGGGNPMLGAPALNDSNWLYGGTRGAIRATLREGRNGIMPAQHDLLYPEKVHLLAAYVYSLSN